MARATPLLIVGFAAFVLVVLSAFYTSSARPEKVLLKDVTTLVLDDSKRTTGRRHHSVPQLKCVGGPCDLAPQRVMCEQKGFDGRDATWECKASMPGARFGKLDVTCEGFDFKKDPYVLAGSCGLEYTLIPTTTAHHEAPYITHSYHKAGHTISNSFASNYSDYQWSWLLTAAMVVLGAYVCYRCAKLSLSPALNIASLQSNWNQWRATHAVNHEAPPSFASVYGTGTGKQATASSGPGFWSGLMGGMGLTYLMGRNRNKDHMGRGVRPAEPVYVVHSPTRSARSPVAGTESGYATTNRR